MSPRRFTILVGMLGIAMAILFAVAPTHAVRHAVNEWLHHSVGDGHHDHHDTGTHGTRLLANGLAGNAFSALHEHHSHPQQCCEAPVPLNVIHAATVGASDWSAVLFAVACFDTTHLDPLRTPHHYVASDPPPASPAMLSLRSIVLLT